MNLTDVFLTFLRLGLTSFGGPVAHLGYFHEEFVNKKKWISDKAYADLVALCQFLPGPASSQVGMAIGLSRAGYLGAIAAWLGFTLPSALILILFASGISKFPGSFPLGMLHGLKIVAVAVVAQAICGMWVKLCPDKIRKILAMMTAIFFLFIPSAIGQIIIIFCGGFFGFFFLRAAEDLSATDFKTSITQNFITKKSGAVFLFIFFLLLIFLPLIANINDSSGLKLFDSLYRAGSLVFGGGHVVLPLLKNEFVNNGWVTKEAFMAGYGVAQAIPGPLFAFSAYLGSVASISPTWPYGALLCLVAAFLPSFLLILGALPFWENLSRYKNMKFAINGINATVVGLLISALYNPISITAITNTKDFILAVGAFIVLFYLNAPSWFVVLSCALVGIFFL